MNKIKMMSVCCYCKYTCIYGNDGLGHNGTVRDQFINIIALSL